MHTLFSSLPLGLFGLGTPELMVVAMFLAFPIFVVAVIAIALSFKHRNRQMWHETARLALEKGQPLPPLPAGESQTSRKDDVSRHDLRAGIVLLAVSLGFYQFLHAVAPKAQSVAAIPGFIGGALILLAILEAGAARKKSSPETRPPQS